MLGPGAAKFPPFVPLPGMGFMPPGAGTMPAPTAPGMMMPPRPGMPPALPVGMPTAVTLPGMNGLPPAQAAPGPADNTPKPQDVLLMIRQGVANQDKAAVKTALQYATQLGTPIEAPILDMLRQWLGEDTFSSVMSKSPPTPTVVPAKAGAPVSAPEPVVKAKAAVAVPAQPPLVVIREGVAKQDKGLVRAALRMAVEQGTQIDKPVLDMLRKWLSEEDESLNILAARAGMPIPEPKASQAALAASTVKAAAPAPVLVAARPPAPTAAAAAAAAQNLQAGRHVVAHHQIEAAAATEQAEHLRRRLQSAEATASNVVAQVEAEAARRAQASQADAAARSDEFARFRSEMLEMMCIQVLNMDQLRKDNAELKNRLAEAEAESPSRRQEPELPPGLDAHRIDTPQSRLMLGLEKSGRKMLPRLSFATRRGLALWTHNTVFIPDTRGEVETYLAWCALDHLHGRCIVYVNEELFDRRVFRQALTAQEFSWMSRKGWGRNKSKTLATVGNVTRDDALNPEGSFMEQIGLAKGEGKGKRNTYSTTVERAMKSGLPFRIVVLSLASTELVKMYNEHLYKLLTR
eukprot:s3905_g3.t1